MSNFSQVVPVLSPSKVSRGIHKKNYVGSEKWDPYIHGSRKISRSKVIAE